MFWKKKTPENIALTIVVNGKQRKVSYEELALSNNLSQEALVRLLVEKKIIDARELVEMLETVRKERYRGAGEKA